MLCVNLLLPWSLCVCAVGLSFLSVVCIQSPHLFPPLGIVVLYACLQCCWLSLLVHFVFFDYVYTLPFYCHLHSPPPSH